MQGGTHGQILLRACTVYISDSEPDKSGIPSCSACHPFYGNGLSLAGFPAIAGQQVGYLTSSLKAYRSNERNAGEYASVMQAVSQNLSDEDIDALANYMHGLYK